MRSPSYFRLLLAACLLTTWGCGKSAENAPPVASGGPSASPQPTKPPETTTPGTAGEPAVANSSTPADAAAKSPVATSPPAAAAPKPPTASPPPPPPKPTAEQLAKWAVPKFEPLQLLACNDAFDGPAAFCFALSPDGKRCVVGGGGLSLGSVEDAAGSVDLLKGHTSEQVGRPIRAVAISSDGRWVAAGDSKGKVLIWTLADQQEVVVIPAHEGYVGKLAFSPDSKLLATTSYSGEVRLWQLPEGKPLKSIEVSSQEVEALAFVSDTQLAAIADEVSLWNVETGAKERTLTSERLVDGALALSSDRRLLAFDDGANAVRFWDVVDAKPAGTPLMRASAHRIAISPDGKWVATSNLSELRVWDAASGQTVQAIDVNGPDVIAMAWIPGTNALAVASDNNRVRVWGVPAAAESLGILPLRSPASSTAEPPAAGERRALTSAQLKQVIDLRSFPRLPGAVSSQDDFASASYSAPIAQAEAETFYRYHLAQAGWKEAARSDASPGLVFHKDGCHLGVTFYPAEAGGAGGAGKLQVSLDFSGNYDVRWLPKHAAAIPNFYESFSSSGYRTKDQLTDVEAGLIRKLHEAGWTAYTRLNAASREEPDSRMWTMLQGGIELTVSIGRPDVTQTELTVQTSVHPTNISLPLPADSGWIEYDASTDLLAVINTKGDLRQTIDFFDKQFAADGWLGREKGRHLQDEKAWLSYVRGQQDLFLRLEQLATGGTRIVIGDAARSSWQLAKPVVEKQDKPGIEAADFALPAGAAAVKFDVDAAEIRFELPDTTAPKVGELFVKQMAAAGWKRDGAGIVDADFTFLTYTKEKAEIKLRARPAGTKVAATIDGDGLLWTKPLPAAPVRVSYDTWLRRNRLPASLDHLDRFLDEMHKIPPPSGK